MKNFLIFILVTFVLALSSRAETEQQPLKLWYNQPAGSWEEALPLGNGLTGAMVFGGISTEQFLLNDNTLWSGGPTPGNRENGPEVLSKVRQAVFEENYGKADSLWRGMHGPYSARYLPMGDLFLNFPFDEEKTENYRRSLDLRNALSTVSFGIDGIDYKRESFISHPDQVMVVKLTASEKGKITFDARLTSKLKYNVRVISHDHLVLEGKAPSHVAHRNTEPEQVVYEPDGEGMTFEVHLKLIATGGDLNSQNGTIGVKNADEVMLLLSGATSFNGFDKSPAFEGMDPAPIASGKLSATSEFNYDVLFERHLTDYRELFDRVELYLGPQQMEHPTDDRLLKVNDGDTDNGLTALYFQYGRYLMIASARKGTPPSNLQGIWNPFVQPPWGSNYTININTQMNYWPAENTNLAECHHSLFDFMEGLAVNGAITAETNYGIRSGWLASHNTDIWAKTSPTGGEDWDPRGAPRWSAWPMGGAWFCQHLWEHYLHNGDVAFLSETAWPLMQGSAEFLLNWMVEDENGFLVTNPSTSPENSFKLDGKRQDISMASTMDMSLIRESFSNILQAAEILGITDPFTERVENAIPRLYPFYIGRLGQVQEWFKDWDDPEDTHRHISHLYSLHPGNQITPQHTPELAKAAKQTLIHRGDFSTGWSMAWKVNWWARLKDGNRAYKIFKEGLTYVGEKTEERGSEGTSTNLFTNAHAAVQVEGNFGGTAGIAELLLQSHEGYIHLLPALPDELSSGEVKGLVARGGFVIDMKWENGLLETVVIYSRLGGNCRVKVNGNLTSRNARLRPAQGENPNHLLAKPDTVPYVNNAQGQLVELIPDPVNIFDFQTEADNSYRLKLVK